MTSCEDLQTERCRVNDSEESYKLQHARLEEMKSRTHGPTLQEGQSWEGFDGTVREIVKIRGTDLTVEYKTDKTTGSMPTTDFSRLFAYRRA